jgi:glycosyltransferase involved in cell wall biosynthesis
MPNVEEFGIAAVESTASGRPVLAAKAGGGKETIIEGETVCSSRHATWTVSPKT